MHLFTYFTLTSWGLCDCLPVGLFIWEAQKNGPRTAAQEIRPKAGNVQGRAGCWESKPENQVSVSTQECLSLKKCLLLWEGQLM